MKRRMLISIESYSHVMNALQAIKAGDTGSTEAALNIAVEDWKKNAIPVVGENDDLKVPEEYL